MSAAPQYRSPNSPTAPPRNPSSSFTQNYDVDVFVSYGHIDNQDNWVTNFHARLRHRLEQLLGTQDIEVWRDPRLDHGSDFRDVLRKKIARSALFISVLSPRYVTSPSCREELDWFVEAAQQTGGLVVDTQSRLIRVMKTKLPEEGMEPPNFKETLGFEFYESDAQNPDVFWEFSSDSTMPRFNQFIERSELLAQSLARMLLRMKRMAERSSLKGADSPRKTESRTVFLAQTTRDLEPRRAAIRSELVGRGHTVLPTEPLPNVGPELRDTVKALLSQADLSVHLIGKSYGVIPEEETTSFGEIQYQLASPERRRPNFHHLIWIPEDLENPEDRQQTFLTKVRSDIDPQGSAEADVIETSFESFKESLLDVMSRKTEAALITPEAKSVYLLCDKPDLQREQLTKIKAYLRGRGHQVELPAFQGEPEELRELEEELIGDTDATLIYYGTAKDAWILRKRKSLLKILSKKQNCRDYARALYLDSPRDDGKVNYFDAENHLFSESPVFPPLLVLGDCEDFEPTKLDSFLQLIEKRA